MYPDSIDPKGMDQISVEARLLADPFVHQGMELIAIFQNRHNRGWTLWLEPQDPSGRYWALQMMRDKGREDFFLDWPRSRTDDSGPVQLGRGGGRR